MDIHDLINALSSGTALSKAPGVYAGSLKYLPSGPVFMVDFGDSDRLVASEAAGFEGSAFQAGGQSWLLCRLTEENGSILRRLFPFTAPRPVLSAERSFGLGDRLGIAAPGQLRAVARFDALPVLAQQSMRELRLTGRSYTDVLNDVSFMVFREGYTGGFGADADHLKNENEVRYGLDCGYTMLTLDCSDFIRYDALEMDDALIMKNTAPQPVLEELYAGRAFSTDSAVISFTLPELRRLSLLYGDSLDFVESVYRKYLADRPETDLEISIDETDCPTTPAQHYFIGAELCRRGVRLGSLAPRFCGEFQKGVDYRGDIKELEKDFELHASIARAFGYKLSLHSGSDKFGIFALFARCTKGHFHVKTAGTSWLEAMAVVAVRAPALYREVHAYALTVFSEAKKYYHVTTDLSRVPPIEAMSDGELITLFSQNDSRQLIHLTYGMILCARDDTGAYRYRDRLFSVWRRYSEDYAQRLDKHISRHLQLLCGGAN